MAGSALLKARSQTVSRTLVATRCSLSLFFTLVTGPRRSLGLQLSDARVYEPQIRARLQVLSAGAWTSTEPAAELRLVTEKGTPVCALGTIAGCDGAGGISGTPPVPPLHHQSKHHPTPLHSPRVCNTMPLLLPHAGLALRATRVVCSRVACQSSSLVSTLLRHSSRCDLSPDLVARPRLPERHLAPRLTPPSKTSSC